MDWWTQQNLGCEMSFDELVSVLVIYLVGLESYFPGEEISWSMQVSYFCLFLVLFNRAS